MLILNEADYAKSLYEGKIMDVKSIMAKIRYVVRYLIHSKQHDDDAVYQETVKWLQRYQDNFDESCYSNVVVGAIKGAHKYPFYHIDNICITQSELDAIVSLNDLRAEKILFVLLCMAKHQSIANGFTNGLVKYSITDVCKMARISVPAEDRQYIVHKILKCGFIEAPKKNDSECLFVKIINNENIVLTLDEADCQELAYAYLNWKNHGVGYGRCECCNKLMKKPKKNPHRFCEECEQIIGDVPDDTKIIKCVDCGQLVYISKFDVETRRCEECNLIYQRVRNAKKNKAYRERNKDKA